MVGILSTPIGFCCSFGHLEVMQMIIKLQKNKGVKEQMIFFVNDLFHFPGKNERVPERYSRLVLYEHIGSILLKTKWMYSC